MTKEYWKSLIEETPRVNFILAAILCFGALIVWLVEGNGNERVEAVQVSLLVGAFFFAARAWNNDAWGHAKKKRKPWLNGIIAVSSVLFLSALVAGLKRPSESSAALWSSLKNLARLAVHDVSTTIKGDDPALAEPPLKLDYERRSGWFNLGKAEHIILTNKSDKPVLPSKGELIRQNGVRHELMLPRIIKPYESADVLLRNESGNLLLEAGDAVEVMCEDFGKPGRITFQ